MKEKDDDFELGKLLNFKDLDDDKLKIFIKLLSDDCSSTFQVISNVLEDNYLFVELLDIFAGSKIQFPTRKKLYKLLEKTYIYSFVKKSNDPVVASKLLAKQYKKRISQINTIVERVDKLIQGDKFQDIEDKIKEVTYENYGN